MKNNSYLLLGIAVLISFLGVLTIYSSTYESEGLTWQLTYKKQILWILIGIVLFFLLSNFNYRSFWDLSIFLFIIAVFFLIVVDVLGAVRLGAQRWIKISWFNFQPSELTKIVMAIYLARYFSKKATSALSLNISEYGIWRAIVIPAMFVAIPAFLIIEQPDLGTAMLIVLMFVSMMFAGGVRFKYLAIILVLILLLSPVFWHFLREYQRNRLLVFLNPNIDPLGAGYTVIQSKIAIGSGGFLGKGWLLGTQSQLNFLPESHTDFIFAAFCEEWGFLGALILLCLYYIILRKGISIALSTADHFGRMLALGITFLLALQIAINVSMNLSLAPVVGVPLPLMSYGGSSILVTFISLGILSNIAKTRDVF